jgi:hypothetical protein
MRVRMGGLEKNKDGRKRLKQKWRRRRRRRRSGKRGGE